MTVENNFSFSYADEYTQLLTELHSDYCRDQPVDVLQYCANFFNRKLEEQRTMLREQQRSPMFQANEFHPLAGNGTSDTRSMQEHLMDSDDHREEEDEEIDDYDDEDFDDEVRDKFTTAPLSSLPPTSYNRDRRTSVSAESMAPTHGHDFVKQVIPKSQDQCQRIRASVGNNFLFKNLDEEQYQDVVNAMAEKHVGTGQTIIEQGGVGDYFYVVESGTFDCYISKGDDAPPNKVTSYEAGGSFGELALMYNAPRAATILATSDAVLWALDRVTFRTILMENTSRKRRMYEAFLEEVPLLKSLEPYERHKIADALDTVYFDQGEKVMTEGDVGDRFYIIESGDAGFYKLGVDGTQQEVNVLGRGSYFGELALLNDTPRAATVVAQSRLKCATLGKKAFTRLLGPVLEILKRNSENYHAIISQQHQEQR
ncbi:camp-dependent protein kinase regulatory subunit [Zychaea mexicana]|uniref:camp-dependent protein kinase regulatory subunit n=1 Tax=Zychaea mexicana TaxID=64656 RepID=UPI0022FECFCF|nr:camp-dependent protein kinase regulatory subunit [Zychaea mexicana]KAI9498225.1 camp-dependent protein kinase regulatory subunit [Zychaea mexicana]